jgi:hypothetical protein
VVAAWECLTKPPCVQPPLNSDARGLLILRRCVAQCDEKEYLPASIGLITGTLNQDVGCNCGSGGGSPGHSCVETKYETKAIEMNSEDCHNPRSYGRWRTTSSHGNDRDPCASIDLDDHLCHTDDGGIHAGYGRCEGSSSTLETPFGPVHRWVGRCTQCVCGVNSCDTSGYVVDFTKLGKPCVGGVCDNKACCVKRDFAKNCNYGAELVMACPFGVRASCQAAAPVLCVRHGGVRAPCQSAQVLRVRHAR